MPRSAFHRQGLFNGKAVLRTGEPAPRVDSIALNYLPKNVAPDFDEVTVQTGTRYQSLPKPVGTDTSMNVGGIQQPRFDSSPPPSATVIPLACDGRCTMTTTIKWSTPFITVATEKAAGCCSKTASRTSSTPSTLPFAGRRLHVQGGGFGCSLPFSRAGSEHRKRKHPHRSGHYAAADREPCGSG